MWATKPLIGPNNANKKCGMTSEHWKMSEIVKPQGADYINM